MKEIPVAVYRGGTSRALFFHRKNLPNNIEEQNQIILKAMGSGHPLQIDGLGGGNPLTSKCAVIGPPSVPGADVDYTFVYPGVTTLVADRKGNCGNISSAVGPFAVNEGLVNTKGDKASVVIHNTNTNSLLRATFEVKYGRFYPLGDYSIDGVPGTGSRVELEFLGDSTQPLLPTGTVKEKIRVPGLPDEIDISIVRAGNLAVFCSMEALGIKGNPKEWKNDQELWQKMEVVRGAVAVRLGMAGDVEEARKNSPAVPKIIAVGPRREYQDMEGRNHKKESHQFRVLTAAMGVMHQSVAVTGAVATAAASVLPGSVVHNLQEGDESDIILGHPSGQLALSAELIEDQGTWKVKKISLNRTAHEISKGVVFIDD